MRTIMFITSPSIFGRNVFGITTVSFFVLLAAGIMSAQAETPAASVVPVSPPAKLADGNYQKNNPLRNPVTEQPIRQAADNSGQPAAPSAFSAAPVAKREDPAKNDAFPQVPQNNNGMKPLSGFGNSVGSPQDNFMDSVFPEDNVRKSAANTSNPKPLPQQLPVEHPAEPKPLPARPPDYSNAVADSAVKESPKQSLGNADPFGIAPSKNVFPSDTVKKENAAADRMIENDFPVSAKPFQNEESSQPIASRQRELPVQKPAGRPAQLAAGEISIGEGNGTPGPAVLEGVQTPHLTIEKILPAEIVVEQPATIRMLIKNAGYSTAKEVIVRDRVPQGTRLLSTSPEAQTAANGELIWLLGNLDANGQAAVEMRIVPLREGEIGSVATIGYTADVSCRKIVTRPKIQVEVKAPQEIQLGETAQLEIIISNPGSATATGIVLEEYVPDGLYHKDGKILVNKNVDTLKPHEAKKLTLPLSCVGNGNLINQVIVTADGNLRAEEKTIIRALSPVLDLDISGAKQCFLERKAEYKLSVSNSGTSSAKNVDLKLTLPTSVQFISTNQSGVYEASTHTVHWALEELPQKESGEINLAIMPGKIGNYTMTFTGDNGSGLKSTKTQQLSIDGLSALSFGITGQPLLEAGREATYEVTISNKGTKPAENVRIRATFPDGLTFVRGEGPSRYQVQGNNVQFEPLVSLEPKGERTYKIAAKCASEGDHRISVQVISDDLRSPITKEESTRVFK